MNPRGVLLKYWRSIQQSDTAPGIGLLVFAAAAMLVANSPLADVYRLLIDTPMVIAIGHAAIDKPLLLWINDGLMALFFLLVGIELKHELLYGHLRRKDQIVFPAAAAIGGMLVPAAIYLSFTAGDPVAANGWAIPAATDIAFALALFAMLARGLPPEVKVLLLAIAIIDDLGAILIIALLYTADISAAALGVAAVAVIGVGWLSRRSVQSGMPYLLLGLVLWVATLKSGVHATLAGVLIGLLLPQRTVSGEAGIGHAVEHALKPWVLFGVLPVFAFANAGIDFREMTWADATHPVVIGIAAGLALGKPLGVAGGIWVAERLRVVQRPASLTWPVVVAVGALCGVGFTMSLFIGSLAFEHAPEVGLADERLGIVAGSLLSAAVAALLFSLQPKRAEPTPASGHID